jgi:hypothetical protein
MPLPAHITDGVTAIGEAVINPIIDEQTSWTVAKNGGGFNLSNLGNLSFAASKGITQDAWTAPTLINSWVDYSATTTTRFRKDKEGYVHIEGWVKDGTFVNGTVLFTLPVGFRPAKDQYFACLHFGGGAYGLVGIQIVAANGQVSVVNALGNSFVCLSGIVFSAT